MRCNHSMFPPLSSCYFNLSYNFKFLFVMSENAHCCHEKRKRLMIQVLLRIFIRHAFNSRNLARLIPNHRHICRSGLVCPQRLKCSVGIPVNEHFHLLPIEIHHLICRRISNAQCPVFVIFIGSFPFILLNSGRSVLFLSKKSSLDIPLPFGQ